MPLNYNIFNVIVALAKYSQNMNQNLYTFARKNGFNYHAFYEAIKELEGKGWVVMVKDLSINKVTLIIKDPVIIANNLIKTLDIMYNKSFIESYKYVEKLNNDYKEVLKDYDKIKEVTK